MTAFRVLLVTIFIAIVLYTIPVVLNHGLGLLTVFFGDIGKMGWSGQFNFDFLGFLVLSALWTAWRNNFSAPGLVLSALAFCFGAPFLTGYLFYLSFRCDQNVQAMLLGEHRVGI
ncbi:MAG: hypothetical protein K0U93_12620 [Gammaproteobacteria bacterium]|nr:hypothetical protein [Gammaproteobacteria bacterium]